MSTLTRHVFLAEMSDKTIHLSTANNDSRLNPLNLNRVDYNNDGLINTHQEMKALFRAVDYFDNNGIYHSINMGKIHHPTTPGKLIAALRDIAKAANIEQTTTLTASNHPKSSTAFKDAAIRNAFSRNITGALKRGDKGNKIVAIQYALGRLGHLDDVCDGDFGKKTLAAVKSFQSATSSLIIMGSVDNHTLIALDHAVSQLDLRAPVIRSRQRPMSYLSNFRALGLPKITLDRRGENITWDSPELQHAYGIFVQNYWEVMKKNNIEADCKALALFFMDQFRKQLAEDTFIELPLPRSRNGSIAKRNWMVATRVHSKGLFRNVVELFFKHHIRVNRPGYEALKNIQKLDPEHAMIYGVNVKYPRTSAHQVSRAATTIAPWHKQQENHGDDSKAEIPLNTLKVGYLIFIDHTGDDHYDHTVTVVKIKKDEKKRVRQLVLAVGSYDDVRDSLASTVVNSLGILNQYSEEVVVDFDKNERITHAEVTYSSEPKYVVKPRYSHTSTLMEKKKGGTLKVSRWG